MLAEAILELPSVSPDGKWVVVAVSDAEDAEHPYRIAAYPVEGGGPRVPLCRTICHVGWDASGTHLVLNMFDGIRGRTFFLATEKGVGLPKMGGEGVGNAEEAKALAKSEGVGEFVESAMTPEEYSFTRVRVRRNLYRVGVE